MVITVNVGIKQQGRRSKVLEPLFYHISESKQNFVDIIIV